MSAEAIRPERVAQSICAAIQDITGAREVSNTTNIGLLSMDSLQVLEVITILEDEFDHDIDGIALINETRPGTVQELAEAFVARIDHLADD